MGALARAADLFGLGLPDCIMIMVFTDDGVGDFVQDCVVDIFIRSRTGKVERN